MSPTKKHFHRRRKLIKARLQLKIVFTFIGIALLPLLLQTLLMGWFLIEAASGLPTGGSHLTAMVPGMLKRSLLFSTLFLLPLTTWVGILATFKFAGPVFRFETYLRKLARGEESEPCRIRDGDELVELCEAINEATEPLRSKAAGSAPQGEAADRAA